VTAAAVGAVSDRLLISANAGQLPIHHLWAAAMLLGLNGLRCGELIACDVTDVGSHS
jgi:hypothetical protein